MPEGEGRSSEALREQFDRYLGDIEKAVSWATRRLCLRGDEPDDFRSWVHLKLIEDDYRILRQFAGRSRMATYLTTVIQNLGRDWRMRRWGRWRPSAAAERLGLAAIQLETLLQRDGFSLDEASEILRANLGVRMSHGEVVELAGRVADRVRLRFAGSERLESVPTPVRADQRARDGDRVRLLERAKESLARALRELDPEDRLLLKMHYESGLTIAAIATALGAPQRRLYTRRDACLRRLRRNLEGAGLDASELLAAAGWSAAELTVDYGTDDVKRPHSGPSNEAREG